MTTENHSTTECPDFITINEFDIEPEEIPSPVVITPSEYVRLLSERVMELEFGKQPLLPELMFEIDSLKIAKAEIDAGVIPISIVRRLPNGKTKKIEITGNELILDH